MAVLTVNPFDDELHRLAKSAAALKGISLREFLEDAIAATLGVEPPKVPDMGIKIPTKSKPGAKRQK